MSLSDQPTLFITKAAARAYVAAGVGRSINRGTGLRLLRDPQFPARDLSAQMGPAVAMRTVEGSPRHIAALAAWKPRKSIQKGNYDGAR